MTAIVAFLELDFTPMTCAEAVSDIVARPADAPFAYVVFPNVDDVLGLARDPGRAPLYDVAWRTLAASPTLEKLARRSGLRLATCTGVDLTTALFDGHIDPAEAVTIVGGSETVIARLQARYGLKDVRWHQPPMRLAEDASTMARAAAFIAAQRARFVFIALGTPQQEMLARAVLERGDATGVGLCIGENLAILAGVGRQAPAWMQKGGVAWLHRLASDPGRLGERYLVDGPAILGLWWRWRSQRRAAMTSRNSR